MDTIKPLVEQHEVRALLEARFGSVADISPIAGGELSRAFSFAADGRDYVIRFNRSAAGFAWDRYAWQHFAAPGIPIPRIVAIDQVRDVYVAISERAAGGHLWSLPPHEHQRLLPAALDVLDRIHGIDVRDGQGFGNWTAPEAGRYESWRAYVAAIIEDEAEGFHQGWHALFRDSFLERDLFERVYARMMRLAERCPQDRAVLHGDYGYDNVLTDGDRITGVVDWGSIAYGDPLYDVAWVGFWPVGQETETMLRDRYAHGPRAHPHYEERVACCQCRIGLDGLRFFARAGKEESYCWVRDRLLSIIS